MNADMTGYSLTDEDFETCKRYCRPGCVVVEMIPRRDGFALDVEWYKPFKCEYLSFSKRDGRLVVLWLHVSWRPLYRHKIGRVLYRNDGGTENGGGR